MADKKLNSYDEGVDLEGLYHLDSFFIKSSLIVFIKEQNYANN